MFAVVVSEVGGRWSPELAATSQACHQLQGMLGTASGGHWSVALVVVRGWRALRGHASHAQTTSMINASEKYHRRRSGARYLEHEFLAFATSTRAQLLSL